MASGLRKGEVEPRSPPSGDPEPPLTIFLLPPPFSCISGDPTEKRWAWNPDSQG